MRLALTVAFFLLGAISQNYSYGKTLSVIGEEQFGVTGFNYLNPKIVAHGEEVRVSCTAFSNKSAKKRMPYVVDLAISKSRVESVNILEKLRECGFARNLNGDGREVVSFRVGGKEAVLIIDESNRQALRLCDEDPNGSIGRPVTKSGGVLRVIKIIENDGEALIFGSMNGKPHLTLLDQSGNIKWEQSLSGKHPVHAPMDVLIGKGNVILTVSNSGKISGAFSGHSNIVATLIQYDGTLIKDETFPGWFGDISSNKEGYGIVYTKTRRGQQTICYRQFDFDLIEKFEVELIKGQPISTPFKSASVGEFQVIAGTTGSGLSCLLIDTTGKVISKEDGLGANHYTLCFEVLALDDRQALILGSSLHMDSNSGASSKLGMILLNIE